MSTEAKHTPGPWRVEGGTTVVWGACNPDDLSDYGMGYPVTDCRITPISNSSWCQGPEYEEGYANANLIAAAPELFEALVTARKYMKLCLGSSFWDGPNPYPIIDAALAKARGEADA